MKKLMLAVFFLFFCVIPCSAESFKGTLEKVDLQKEQIVVDGVTVKIAKNASLKAENRMSQEMSATLQMMTSYVGNATRCIGTKTGPKEFTATKVRVYDER